MNDYKHWLVTLGISFIVLTIVATPIMIFNYLMDPFWVFGTNNKYNQIQNGFNERQQKLGKLTYEDHQYDTLLIGSSRTTYIPASAFSGMDVFNLSVSSMLVDEYGDYINYAKKVNGKPFDTIILGVDFFATNKFRTVTEPASFYVDTVSSPLYRFKLLTSFDTFKKAKEVYDSTKLGKPLFEAFRYYNTNNEAKPFPLTNSERSARIETYLLNFYKDEVNHYEYDSTIIQMLQKIKNDNPTTKFIIYTTPEAYPRFRAQLDEENYRKGYEQWLHDLTDVYGEIYHYMTADNLSRNLTNFIDSHHITPETGEKLAQNMSGTPEQYGILLTSKNVEPFLTETFASLKNDDLDMRAFFRPEHAKISVLNKNIKINTDEAKNDIPLGTMKEVAGKKVTVIVTLRANQTTKPVQLYIKEKGRTNYNTIVSPTSWRSFKVSRTISNKATEISFGVSTEGSNLIEVSVVEVCVEDEPK